MTASGIVIEPRTTRMLVIHHTALDCWLQPGGHIEPADITLASAALREIAEETGIGRGDLQPVTIDGDTDTPFDLDSHPIPARPAKNEMAHTHHDARYLFKYTGQGAFVLDGNEIKALDWWTPEQLAATHHFGDTFIRKLRSYLGQT